MKNLYPYELMGETGGGTSGSSTAAQRDILTTAAPTATSRQQQQQITQRLQQLEIADQIARVLEGYPQLSAELRKTISDNILALYNMMSQNQLKMADQEFQNTLKLFTDAISADTARASKVMDMRAAMHGIAELVRIISGSFGWEGGVEWANKIVADNPLQQINPVGVERTAGVSNNYRHYLGTDYDGATSGNFRAATSQGSEVLGQIPGAATEAGLGAQRATGDIRTPGITAAAPEPAIP